MWFHLLALAKMENSNKKENAAQSSVGLRKMSSSRVKRRRRLGPRRKCPSRGRSRLKSMPFKKASTAVTLKEKTEDAGDGWTVDIGDPHS